MGKWHFFRQSPRTILKYLQRKSYCTQWFQWFWGKNFRLVLHHRALSHGIFFSAGKCLIKVSDFEGETWPNSSQQSCKGLVHLYPSHDGREHPFHHPFLWQKHLWAKSWLLILRFPSSRPICGCVFYTAVQESQINSTRCGMWERSFCVVEIYSIKATSDTEANVFSIRLNLRWTNYIYLLLLNSKDSTDSPCRVEFKRSRKTCSCLAWRIIPFVKWLTTMVSKSPK